MTVLTRRADVDRLMYEETHADVGPRDTLGEWWCIEIDPRVCICGTPYSHVESGDHRVVVWPEMDDEDILRVAAEVQKEWAGSNPRIAPFGGAAGKKPVRFDELEGEWIA